MNKLSKYSRSIKLIFFIAITALYSVTVLYLFWSLSSHSYVIDESKLYRLDSIKIQDKAYYSNGIKSGESYYFEDTERMPFLIGGDICHCFIGKTFIYDTLRYNGTVLTIYTDKDGYIDYTKRNKWVHHINVYQFYIGNRKCVDMNALSLSNKERDRLMIIVATVFTLYSHLFSLIKRNL